ncbi:MAG: TonB-dependent receptor [Akkermansiaceae bacterium]|nr:TonB-dependent receptor [Akkermansiaceae bacterium]
MKKTTTALSCKAPTPTGSLLLAASLFTHASLFAHPETLDESTILATGFSTGKEDTGLRVNVEDAGLLQDIGIRTLNDAILFSPGVNIFSSGGNGTISSLFTRGTESDHTALFVDGVKLTNSRVFPFPASNILSGAGIHSGERIELLRGPQSALYGSDAIGGVLSLSLDKGSDHGTNRAWLEFGSFDTTNSGISFQGQEGKLSYNSFVSWNQTANDRKLNDHESLHAGVRLDYSISDTTSVGFTLRVLNFETELPPLGFTPYAVNETENTVYSVFIEHHLTDAWYTKLSFNGYQSKFTNTGGFADSLVESESQNVSWANRYTWNEQHETSAGIGVTYLDTTNSGAGIGKFSEQSESIYFQHRWHVDGQFDLLGGMRYDHYDEGESSTTFRIAGSYQACELAKLHASVASAFRRPSAVDLFGFFGSGGNLDLQSEESLGWDAGITLDTSKTSSIDLTYFHNEIDNMIAFGPPPTYTAMNIQEARTRGVELSYRATFLDERIQTRLAYTWLQAENLTTGTRLLRRPSHTLNADINGKITDKLLLGAGVTWVANREDVDASTFARIDAEDYATARLYLRYQLNDSVSFNGRVENLFNQKYAEIDGFPARGTGAFAGITIEW